jgi:hypothetical protein
MRADILLGGSMLAVISWDCDCGAKIKTMYETEGSTTVRCPNPACHTKHIVTGTITELWVMSGETWVADDIEELIVSAAD